MPISSWVLPVLWREQDWRAALGRLAAQLQQVPATPQSRRAAVELGSAWEYIEPDRRCAIAAYELGGEVQRARELAVELGWGAARARLSLAARATDPDPRLILDEAEAWWDAGQPELCSLALAGARVDESGPRAAALAELLAGRDRTADVRARAVASTGLTAADAHVMAARFAGAGKRVAEVARSLEAALVASPGHPLAARWLLALAIESKEPERIHRCIQVRLAGLAVAARIDSMRACALALLASGHHHGLGLRMLRQALELAYESQCTQIPGHLAMWSVLAAHAMVEGTRLQLLPFVLTALQSCREEVDRVWLGALATEVSLRDARNVVVAGAYAEIVAEFAPEHPIVGELILSVAHGPTASAVPPAAVLAAAHAASATTPETERHLDDVYAGATETATQEIRIIDVIEETDTLASKKALPIPRIAKPAVRTTPPRVAPVLAALRTPDRPAIPPPAATRAEAVPRARRISMPIDVTLVLADGTRIPGHSRDISTSGLFVMVDANLAIGAEPKIELLLPAAEAFMEDQYDSRARVARRARGGYGIELLAANPTLLAALAAL